MSEERFAQMLSQTVASFEASLLRDVPPCAYRGFCAWALSGRNPHRAEWMQTLGITQTVNLNVQLLGGVTDDREWEQLSPYAVAMATYQLFEVVSDNLAIGLARPEPGDSAARSRHTVLRAFNGAMLQRLRGGSEPASQLLAPWRELAGSMSVFSQSLSVDKHAATARMYLEEADPRPSLEEIEFSVWPLLVANIELCAALARESERRQAGPLVVDGLIQRYAAVDRLLASQEMPLDERARVGAGAILVIPTLGYYASVMSEVVRPMRHFPAVLEDGSFAEALSDAALLVRLTNDLGRLVTQGDKERAALMAWLRSASQGSAASLDTLLLDAVGTFGPLLARLNKDVSHGEFNVAVDGLAAMPSVALALDAFEERLVYFSRLYAARSARLGAVLNDLHERLGPGEVVSVLIGRFVRFHEMLYSNPYRDGSGEYAV